MKMLCPACGYENLPGVDFCEECMSDLSHLDDSKTSKSVSRIEKAILKERVYQIVSPPSIIVTPETPLHEALKIMAEKSVSSIVIKAIDDKSIKGIFTERSFVKRAALGFPENANDSISNYMATNPVVMKSRDKIVNVLHLMFVAGYSYAIIDGTPPRVISIKDILKYVIELYPSLAGFDKLFEELYGIANQDGVITPEEQKILTKFEEKKEGFLRIFARFDSSSGTLQDEEKELLEALIEEFIPSIEDVAGSDSQISMDESALLRKLIAYFEENKERLLA